MHLPERIQPRHAVSVDRLRLAVEHKLERGDLSLRAEAPAANEDRRSVPDRNGIGELDVQLYVQARAAHGVEA